MSSCCILTARYSHTATVWNQKLVVFGGWSGSRCNDVHVLDCLTWEWEEIKQLPRNPRIIEQTAGKVVKVISALLPSLPRPHRYKIIYMVRPTQQVVDSQMVMLDRQGQKSRSEKQHLIEVQEAHSRQIRHVLSQSDRVDLLEVSYPDLVADPQPVIEQLEKLLGSRFQASPAVSACIKPKLFRNR